MAEETESTQEQFSADDVFFECPRCGKSMGIAKEGIGMVVECINCGLDIRVPSPGEDAQQAREDETQIDMNAAKSQAPDHFDADYTLKKEKRDLLFDEIAAIQRSLDRLVAGLDSTS